MGEIGTKFTQNNKRIATNTLVLYFRMILIMLMTLYTSRVILNTLGVEDYGIYNIVGGIVSMFAFFNSAMSNATQRFLSFDIGQSNTTNLRKTFNAAQVIHFAVALIIFALAETVGLWFVKSYLVIPSDRMTAALWVYHFSVLSFMITVVQVPYNAILIAHERMKVFAYISILEVTFKLLIVLMLTWVSFDKLQLYGVLYFFVVLFIALIYRIYVLRQYEETKFEIVKDSKLYHALISYSGWSLFGNIAVVAKGQGVNVLLNIFFGPIVNAAQAIATQIQGALSSFSNNFQMAINPQIIKSYATGDTEYMTSLVVRGAKFSFSLLFLLSLPIAMEVDQILFLWLKTVPRYTSIFTTLVLIVILIDCVSGPLMTAVQATGKIKSYQIVVGTLQILILPISYLFFISGYAPQVTLFVTIIISIVALTFRLLFLQKLVGFPVGKFLRDVLLRNLMAVFLSLTLPLILKQLWDPSIFRLITISIISIIWASLMLYKIGLDREERGYLHNLINKIRKR